jgi:hypothetical protein
MRIALIYDKAGKVILRHPDGSPRAFPVFRWYHLIKHPKGWEFHLLAFCSASTEDYRFQRFQGVITLGRSTNRPNKLGLWLELTLGRFSVKIGGNRV